MEERKILIATKTYPSISTKYKETVCTAGLLLDDKEKPLQWIRIYPIRFRALDFDRRYPRWSIISAELEINDKDSRPESFRINDSSIKVIKNVNSKKNWAERKSFVLPLQFESTQDIRNQNRTLGIIKPRNIDRYFYKITERNWSSKQQAVQDQMDLLEPSVELEKIPYQFGYQFVEQDGTSHRYTISNWEISQLYRGCRDRSKEIKQEDKEKEAVLKVRKKLEQFLSDKELYFIIGNLKIHSQNFMIIGLFNPPKVKFEQMSLFL